MSGGLLGGVVRAFMGVPIHVTRHANVRVKDWSACRSPARAKRRHAQGHRQHMRVVERPVVLLLTGRGGQAGAYMSAATLARIEREAIANSPAPYRVAR